MTGASDWRRVTKTLLGVSLIAGPLLIAIGELISSPVYGGDDYTRYLASIEDHSAAYYTGNLISVLGTLCLVGAVVALTHLVRVRHAKYGLVVGGFALLCVTMLPGIWLFSTIAEYQFATSGDQAVFAQFLDRTENASSMIPLFVVWIGMVVSFILLAAGLAWSRTLPRWMSALLGVAVVLLFFSDEGVLGTIASLVMLAALGAIGTAILRSTVAEWEAGDLTVHESPVATPPATAPLVH